MGTQVYYYIFRNDTMSLQFEIIGKFKAIHCVRCHRTAVTEDCKHSRLRLKNILLLAYHHLQRLVPTTIVLSIQLEWNTVW